MIPIIGETDSEPNEEPRFVACAEQVDQTMGSIENDFDPVVITSEIKPVVIDTTFPEEDGSFVRRRMCVCEEEEAAGLIAMALNLLVRAQAQAMDSVAKNRARERGNGSGGLIRP